MPNSDLHSFGVTFFLTGSTIMVPVTINHGRAIAGPSISSFWVMPKVTCLTGAKHSSDHVSQPLGFHIPGPLLSLAPSAWNEHRRRASI